MGIEKLALFTFLIKLSKSNSKQIGDCRKSVKEYRNIFHKLEETKLFKYQTIKRKELEREAGNTQLLVVFP